uniref:Uncharacterized protein n=1 Tax=viral metagenome TaxID=1070528 RepID=A0A6C0C7J6_9ZZZZ
MQGPELDKPFYLSSEALQIWNGMINGNVSNPVIPTNPEHIDCLIELDRNFPKAQQKREQNIIDFGSLKSDFILANGKRYHPMTPLPAYDGYDNVIIPVLYAPLASIPTIPTELRNDAIVNVYDPINKNWDKTTIIPAGTPVDLPSGTFCSEPEVDGIVNSFWLYKKKTLPLAFWVISSRKEKIRFRSGVDTFVIPNGINVTINGVSSFSTCDKIAITVRHNYFIEPPHEEIKQLTNLHNLYLGSIKITEFDSISNLRYW